MEILTAPERPSFYQEEEIDLAKTKDIKKHAKKYFWLKNSYNGSQIMELSFFEERRRKLSKNLAEEIGKKIIDTRLNKAKVKMKFALSKKVMEMAKAISEGVGWQDERKKYIFMAIHYQDQMLNEIARRYNYRREDFDNVWHAEVAEILKGKDLRQELNLRRRGFGVLYHTTCLNLSPKNVAFYWNTYLNKHQVEDQKQVRGVIASKGKSSRVKGRVRILLNPAEAEGFNSGDILIAPMTSPEYVFVMKKSAAVVTDAGGLTCHAAIVSRELGIPCVVGTKIASRIFKDGDLVEVDALRGTVTKLN